MNTNLTTKNLPAKFSIDLPQIQIEYLEVGENGEYIAPKYATTHLHFQIFPLIETEEYVICMQKDGEYKQVGQGKWRQDKKGKYYINCNVDF